MIASGFSGQIEAQTQVLKLVTTPQFAFINENITVGELLGFLSLIFCRTVKSLCTLPTEKPLPNVQICAEYTGDGPLALLLTGGDTQGYFRSARLNSTCWTLILQKELDADVNVFRAL